MKKPIIAIVGLLAAAGISTGVFLKVKNNNELTIYIYDTCRYTFVGISKCCLGFHDLCP